MKLKPLLQLSEEVGNKYNKSRNRLVKGQELSDLLANDYSDAYALYKKGEFFYRGKEGLIGPHVTDPSSFVLGSKDSETLYPFYLDYISSWESFPSRTKSVKFTRSDSNAGSYGEHVYYVLPKNGANIGVSNTSDFWDSFHNIYVKLGKDFHGLLEFCTVIETIVGRYVYKDVGYDKNDPSLVLKGMELLMKDTNRIKDVVNKSGEETGYNLIFRKVNTMAKAILSHAEAGHSFHDFLDYCLSPEENKIGHTTNLNVVLKYERNEMWTDSPCLLFYDEQDLKDALESK